MSDDAIYIARAALQHDVDCVHAIDEHLGGRPELVEELTTFVRTLRDAAEECALSPALIGMSLGAQYWYERARALLAQIEGEA